MVDTNTELIAPVPLRTYPRRVLQCPRAWALSYLLTTLFALGLALLTTIALLPLTRYPAFARLLETHSLDLLLDFITLEMSGGGIPLGIPVLLALPAWAFARLIWTWLEGGTLAEYAAAQPLSWRAFAQAGWRWFGVFLALNLIGAVLVVVIGGVTLLLAVFAYLRAPALGWTIGGAGLAVTGLVATWIEMARAIAVTQNRGNAFHALGDAARALFRQAASFFALVGVGLVLYGLLYLAYRWLMDILPLHWWLATLLIQQAHTILRLGIRLTRQAGQVGLLMSRNRL
jgi:hypothetical protein